MVIFPNAKINLGLSVNRKRNDGFHDIESIFYPIGLCDALEYIPESDLSENESLSYSGPFPVEGRDICLKLTGMLRDSFSFPPLRMHIYKNIPAGAGLGGGSADAAFLLKSLNELYSFGLNPVQLEEWAARIGSDCPFFIRNHPSLVTGKGEYLQDIPLDLKGYYFLLIYPGIHASTAEAYKEVVPSLKSANLKEITRKPVNQWKHLVMNHFENPVFRKYPLLADIKKELYDVGAIYASMTGSGSAMYGLFDSEIKIPQQFSHYFIFGEWLK
jgi:4-diphosphocytidyl-2-C-methyl-D-erythritol kinase